jgi:hypothetical protein
MVLLQCHKRTIVEDTNIEDSSSDAGDSESSVADLDPDLQAMKGLPVETRCHSTILIFHIDSMRKKSSKTSTLKIRIPVLADKRKRSANESPQPSEGELEKRMPKKSKPSAQTPKKQGEKDMVITKHAKKRGHPKGVANKTKKDFMAKKDFTVPVFLEIAQEPLLVRGKTGFEAFVGESKVL